MLFIPLSSIGEEAKSLISSEPVPPSVSENNADHWGSLWSRARLVTASAMSHLPVVTLALQLCLDLYIPPKLLQFTFKFHSQLKS